jgi:hypothetical protein
MSPFAWRDIIELLLLLRFGEQAHIRKSSCLQSCVFLRSCSQRYLGTLRVCAAMCLLEL